MAAERENWEKVIKRYPSLSIKKCEGGKNKIVCEITSHEMPCNMKAVKMYVNGKKYKHACEHQLTTVEKELVLKHLVEERGQFYCKLTKRYINNRPQNIRLHLNGKRFQKALNNMNCIPMVTSIEEKPMGTTIEDGVDMWIPLSESESEDIEALDPEFIKDKTETAEGNKNEYSFDVLENEAIRVPKDTEAEFTTERSPVLIVKKGKRKQKNTTLIPKKKRKRT